MKEELLFLGAIFSLCLIAYVYYSVIKRFVTAVKEKNHQWAIIEFVIFLAITAICVFIVKPFHMTVFLVSMFQ